MLAKSGLFRFVPRQKSPAARAEQKPEIVPTARIVDGINGDIVAEQACHETNGGDKPVQQAVPESVLPPGQASLYGFDTGTGNEEAAGEQGRQEEQEGAMLFHQLKF